MYINWGKYGEYELVVSENGMEMVGSAKGQPNNWRKLKRIGSLAAGTAAVHEHDH